MMKSERRIDSFSRIDPTPFVQDADGYLVGRAVVSTIGVFPYLLSDGTVFNELRLPEEVFSPASLETLKLKPLTNEHPKDFVNSDNIQSLQVGTTGEDVSRFEIYGSDGYAYKTDGTELSIPLKITDHDTIMDVLAGKRGLSCGYTRELELKTGTWCGQHFDGIQRNIRYNHVAVVDVGRAGDTARINMNDSAFVPTYVEKVSGGMKNDSKGTNNYKEDIKHRSMVMKKLILDGKTEFEVEDTVVQHIEGLNATVADLQKKLDSVNKDKATIEGELSVMKQQKADLEAKMKNMVTVDSINELVKERQAISDTADKFGVKLDENMSIVEMKRAVVKKAVPSLSESIDKKDEAFVNGAFDACKSMNIVSNGDVQNSNTLVDGNKQDGANDQKVDAIIGDFSNLIKF